jgi:hypothetical protein
MGKATDDPTKDSTEWLMFQALAYEFPSDDPRSFDTKVRRKLRRAGRPFSQEMFDQVRSLKNDLQAEISKSSGSSFYVGGHTGLASLENFDFAALVGHYGALYPTIPEDGLRAMINFSIYLYYLR